MPDGLEKDVATKKHHRAFTGHSQDIHRISQVIHKTFTWHSHGIHRSFTGYSRGIHTALTCCQHGIHMIRGEEVKGGRAEGGKEARGAPGGGHLRCIVVSI